MDETTGALKQAVQDYLEWMAVNGYAKSTQQDHQCTLRHFRLFIDIHRYHWDDIFTRRTLDRFKKAKGKHHAHAVTGLSRYLYAQGKIARPIRVRKALPMLPVVYEDYLLYRKKYRHASDRLANHIRRVLYLFDGYCQRNDIQLRSLKIDHVDAFRDECFTGFASATRRVYRIYLRGFLNYLYHERQVLAVDLAPLLTGRREYGRAKPPKFLRPAEVQQLFASLDPSSASGIRTYALVHLAYSMGLRPIEISQLRLEDIGFSRQLMRVAVRKGDNPLELPIPEHTLKAVAAYIIGARPKTTYRRQRGYAPRAINPPLAAFDRYLKAHNVTWDQLLQPAFFLHLRATISPHPNTTNRMLSHVRSLFDYLICRQIVTVNPLKDIPPVPERYFVPFVFSPDQTEQLLKAVCVAIRRNPIHFLFDLGIYLAVVMLARCGMRINEPLRLGRHHYRPDEGSVYIERTKFRKDRLTPLPKSVLIELENYLAVRDNLGDQNRYLLAGRKDQPLKAARVRTVFHRAVEAIGLKQPRRTMGNMTFGAPVPHSLRHSFAINTLNRIKARGISPQQALPVMAAYMGHRKYQYTAAYLKVKDAGDLAGLIAFTKSQLDVV